MQLISAFLYFYQSDKPKCSRLNHLPDSTMKKLFFTLLIFTAAVMSLPAQKITKTQKVKDTQLPKAVKEAYENSMGFPVSEWVKLIINTMPRYVSVFQQMNPSSGKTLTSRFRYDEKGKLTSRTEYRGDGKGEEKDFFYDYLSGDAGDGFENKIAKLLQDNTLISYEGFSFVPANQPDKEFATHRFVLKDQKGQRVILYFDTDGKEIDMSKYPVRKVEAEEMDSFR